MGTSVTLRLDTRKAKKNNTFPLKLRIVHKRVTLNIPLGFDLKINEWNEQGEKIKSSAKRLGNVSRINAIIQKKKSNALNLIIELEADNILDTISPLELKNKIAGKSANLLSLNDFIQTRINEMNDVGQFGNARVYKSMLAKLSAFTKKRTLQFSDIDFRFLTKLEQYHVAQGSSLNSLSVHLRALRACFNYAIKSRIISDRIYPFRDYKIKSVPARRKAMSENDFTIFKSLQFNKGSSLFHAHNFFMMSFYLRGMNWMDMCLLQQKNIIGDNERIVYRRSKTKTLFSIKIQKTLLALIGYYKSANNEFLIPVILPHHSKKKYSAVIRYKRNWLNKKLKQIAREHNLDSFSIYTARHTWATQGKRKGVPTNALQEGLGHATEQQTQEYLDSFENAVLDQYDELIISD